MRTTTDLIEAVLAGHPAVVNALADAHRVAITLVDPVTLELCRLRIATLLGNVDESVADAAVGVDPALVEAIPAWPTSPLFTEAQRACLALTEEFVIDVASLSDATAQRVLDSLGDQGFADFVNALLVIEQRQRMRLVWQQLFQEVSDEHR